MNKNTSVALGSHFSHFVSEQVSVGRFGNASEVIRAGLRLLEEHETKLAALRAAVHEGIESGPAEKFSFDKFIHLKKVKSQSVDEDRK